ncbi:MAG: riboflavin biosynthesis protein RibD [Rhodospirillales bacterium 20-60-12]|nr:MAG: riboflavin biosynthesis protein RibD [Rhodospirillales bacterium 20-60-12]HQT68509.1 bifunctional diaminohydroxyphosphoribosylaminopyrimidine deaminase/5-amino-6-(5-phosphoribosylamino)uracil reductase RibD [Acetobacteraceae bacterium]
MSDVDHMRAALALARRGLGETAPNPSVGCVIVREGRVLGRGRTAPGGRPHAETIALAMAGPDARGATAYVTLEPCAHVGKTPPCTEALIEAGIARVVVAVRDPDKRVNGQGIARLRDAGIEVTEDICRAEASILNAGFFSVIQQGRPLVRLKLASTLDGRIATKSGESQWISGPEARRATHAMRGRHDALMVGVGTVLADNPELTCRLAGFRQRGMIRIIVDSHLRTPLTGNLVRSAGQTPLWLLHRDGADPARMAALKSAGVRLFELPASSTGIDLKAGLEHLAKSGITRLMVEGGATLAAALLREHLVDRLAWFHAPAIMGGDGYPAAQAFGVANLASMPRFQPVSATRYGQDYLTTFRKVA